MKEFANNIGAFFQLTSASQNVGIDQLFNDLGKRYIDPDYEVNGDGNTVNDKKKEDKEKNKKQKGKKHKEEENTKGVALNANVKKRKKKFCIF